MTPGWPAHVGVGGFEANDGDDHECQSRHWLGQCIASLCGKRVALPLENLDNLGRQRDASAPPRLVLRFDGDLR
jgi:hypothetical protein